MMRLLYLGLTVTDTRGRDSPANTLQVRQSWPQNMDQDPKESAPASSPEATEVIPTNNDLVHFARLLCGGSLQSLMDLVCSQVKEVQVIFHRVAVS